MSQSLEESLETMAQSRIATPSFVFTRPNNTTQYSIGDLLSHHTSLATVAPYEWELPEWAKHIGGIIQRVYVAKSGDTTSNAGLSLFVYTQPIDVINAVDNTPWLSQARVWEDRTKFSAIIAGPTFVAGKTGSGAGGIVSSNQNVYFAPTLNNRLYVLPYYTQAYVPIANEEFYMKAFIVFP